MNRVSVHGDPRGERLLRQVGSDKPSGARIPYGRARIVYAKQGLMNLRERGDLSIESNVMLES